MRLPVYGRYIPSFRPRASQRSSTVLRAEGGGNGLLRVPGVLDENELVLAMIASHRVSGQPGYFFDMESNGYLAISLLPEPDEFERNVRAVLAAVNGML